MRNAAKLTIIGLLCLGATPAQSDALQTNLVQHINIRLTVYSQGDAFTNASGSIIRTKVNRSPANTKDLIEILGEATTNSFSRRARLLLITPLPDDESMIVVRDGTNRVDVTAFFTLEQLNTNEVRRSRINTVTGMQTRTDYSILRLAFHDASGFPSLTAHFDLSGFGTIRSSTIRRRGTILGEAHRVIASLAGTGDFTDAGTGDTNSFVARASLNIAGSAVETTP